MVFNYKNIAVAFLFVLSFSLSAQQGTVSVTQSKAIDKLLEYKKDIETVKLYKIQVYQNVDPDRAQREKSVFLNAFSDWPVEIHWDTPNYKVWVGNFASRLEADRAMEKIKKKYMNANVIKPRTDKKKRS